MGPWPRFYQVTIISGGRLRGAAHTDRRISLKARSRMLLWVVKRPWRRTERRRHRLSRGGDRDANRALYLLALGRMGWDPATRTYVTRRTAAGLSKPEIIRCLKRYLARELYRLLVKPPTSLSSPADGDDRQPSVMAS